MGRAVRLLLFTQTLVFPAAIESLFGSFHLSLNPTLTTDFWAFDQSIPILLKGLAHWLSPEAYETCDKIPGDLKKWHRFAIECSDFYKPGATDPELDPYLEIKYVKANQK